MFELLPSLDVKGLTFFSGTLGAFVPWPTLPGDAVTGKGWIACGLLLHHIKNEWRSLLGESRTVNH